MAMIEADSLGVNQAQCRRDAESPLQTCSACPCPGARQDCSSRRPSSSYSASGGLQLFPTLRRNVGKGSALKLDRGSDDPGTSGHSVPDVTCDTVSVTDLKWLLRCKIAGLLSATAICNYKLIDYSNCGRFARGISSRTSNPRPSDGGMIVFPSERPAWMPLKNNAISF